MIEIEQEQSSGVPAIWILILAILGTIIFLMAFAYMALRYLQRKRRQSLQRRLVSGEVDMEAGASLAWSVAWLFDDIHGSQCDGSFNDASRVRIAKKSTSGET